MSFLSIIILALVQGITEFLPISSSGHLVLIHAFSSEDLSASWDEDMLLDVAVHVGTLFSVLVYFRKDLWLMLRTALSGFKDTQGRNLIAYILIASIPVIIAGFFLHMFKPGFLRTIEVMAWATIIFGALLWWVDTKKPSTRDMQDMTFKDAFLIGLSQALALIPGTSRSGITMTTARFLGFSRKEAAHFSLLLAIVAITGAGALATKDLVETGNAALTLEALIAAGLSFISGWIAIALMMKWLERSTFTPFAIYRVVLGGALLVLIYSGVLSDVTLVSP